MLDAIWNRASIRHYKPDHVPDAVLEDILRAALHAPSANNSRPWHIVVVTDPEKRAELSNVHQWARFCAESPVVLAFCGDPAVSEHWWIEDCCAAVENAMIEAVSQGLGTCWIGIRGGGKEERQTETYVRKALAIPDNIRVLALVSLGYPAADPKPKEPGPMTNIHHGSW